MRTVDKRTFTVDIVETTGSTNSDLKERCRELPPFYTLRARYQSAGRGRFDRSWVVQDDSDLTFSTLVPVDASLMPYLMNIPQITALAICRAIDSESVPVKIKWPNDLLVNERKLAGILVEGVFQEGKQFLVVGIGLNLNSDYRSVGGVESCSLFTETGKKFDHDSIMKEIVSSLIEKVDVLREKGMSPFVDELNRRCAFLGERRQISAGSEIIDCQICGVNDTGALIVRDQSGTMRELISGEISFRS